MQPARIAIGPEPTQQIPQNQHAGQPQVRSRAPLDVTFVAANLTPVESHLELRGRGKELASPLLAANGNVTMQTSLPTGVYRIAAAEHPRRQAGPPRRRPVPIVVRERRPAPVVTSDRRVSIVL